MVRYVMPAGTYRWYRRAGILRVRQSKGSLKIKTLGSFETSVTNIRQAYLPQWTLIFSNLTVIIPYLA